VTVGIANSATHAYAESGIPMLRNQNIKENYLDDTDLIYIKPEFAAKYESKKLKENDIIAMRTGYPGIACLVPKKYEGCQTFTTLIVRLKAENNPSYVCSYINSDLGKRFIEAGKVGVAQQNFGAKSLAKMPIKIAPKELQDEYADFVNKYVLEADLIIWDDIATKVGTEFELNHLLNMINTRMDNGKSNIFTSNLGSKELANSLGERLASRICNKSIDIELHGADKRYLSLVGGEE
jgi:hypothetical protein